MKVETLRTGVHLFWALILITLLIYKWAVYGTRDTFQYFTNWAWAFYAFYYTTTAFNHSQVPGFLRNVSRFVTKWTFGLHTTLVWFVSLSVYVFLWIDPSFLERMEFNVELGHLVAGQEAFHFFPTIAWLALLACNWTFISDAVVAVKSTNRIATFVCVRLAQVLVLPFLYFVTYMFVIDVAYNTNYNVVYNVDIHAALAVTAFVFLSTAINYFVIWIIDPSTRQRSSDVVRTR